MTFLLFFLLVCLVQGQVTSVGSFNGVLNFRNTRQASPPFASPCCSEIYSEVATLVASATALNFSSPGTTLSCGPSPPGWFAFVNLVKGPTTNCYVGDIRVGAQALGKGRVYWDGETVRTAVWGNSDKGDCNFTAIDTLSCNGTGATFFQPIVGAFYKPVAANGPHKKDGVTVITVPGTSNAYLVHDDDQLMVIDSGNDDSFTATLIAEIKRVIKEEDVHFRSIFITHPHRDHLNGIWALKKEFPKVPIFVATEQAVIELTSQKGGNNPQDILQVLEDKDDLWDGEVLIITDNLFGLVGETVYYSLLWFPGKDLLFVGDHIYVNTHLWLASSDFNAQCSWIHALKRLHKLIPEETVIFPGHGPMGTNASAIIEWNIDYLTDAYQYYALSCTLNQTSSWLSYKYPQLAASSYIITYGGAPRVPSSAMSLGCVCSQKASCSEQGIKPPVCIEHNDEDDCDSPQSCGLVDVGLSAGAKAGIIIGSVGVAALLIIAIAILAMGGSKSSDDTYASFG